MIYFLDEKELGQIHSLLVFAQKISRILRVCNMLLMSILA